MRLFCLLFSFLSSFKEKTFYWVCIQVLDQQHKELVDLVGSEGAAPVSWLVEKKHFCVSTKFNLHT